MKYDNLSLFSYFGGKARFCKEIAELLDYQNTDIYIEPFGGAASVLLNKPPHEAEIYSDVTRGLVALMGCLSDEGKASELIEKLYDETEYSEECFQDCFLTASGVEDSILKKELARVTKGKGKVSALYERFVKEVEKVYPETQPDKIPRQQLLSTVHKIYNRPGIFSQEEKQILMDWERNHDIREALLSMDSFDINDNVLGSDMPDELELAKAAYVVYSMSRDGMGTAFSRTKFRSTEDYYRRVDSLYQVAERLKGVQVTGAVGALTYLLTNEYKNYDKAMFYIDAPYLSPDEDEKDLGLVYKGRMNKADHELLLDCICKSNAKFLISNYDNETYNERLKGWRKITIDTYTSVGGKKGNARTECLWCNY